VGDAALKLLLPEHLERHVPGARRGLAFGIPALDAALHSGIQRGQITALEAPLGTGGTALLLALAEATLQADEGVALVDAERTLAPQAAAHLAARGAFWVVRPRATQSAWWCADVLLRTGAFGLVIVDQAPAPARQVAVRLQHLARDKDTALVIRGRTAAGPGARPPFSALVLTVHPRDSGFVPGLSGGAWPAPRTLQVTIEKGGAPRALEVPLGFVLPHRLRPHWAVRDRSANTGSRISRSGRGQRPRAAQPHWPEP